jgi:MFS family permease
MPTLWRPLRTPIFRNLLIADVMSDIGTFMQTVGAAWLMLSLGAGPMYVALTQTASALPFFVFALPAGAIGDQLAQVAPAFHRRSRLRLHAIRDGRPTARVCDRRRSGLQFAHKVVGSTTKSGRSGGERRRIASNSEGSAGESFLLPAQPRGLRWPDDCFSSV